MKISGESIHKSLENLMIINKDMTIEWDHIDFPMVFSNFPMGLSPKKFKNIKENILFSDFNSDLWRIDPQIV